MVNGILNVNKPERKTSFDIVSLIRRLSGERRVGHAGTLDPAATGVLPICLGQGTRIVQFLVDTKKAYRAEIELGVTTSTYDASGEVVWQGDFSRISKEQAETVLNSFIGTIQQVPPMYSALKHQGRPLYELARLGVAVERQSRTVIIHQLRIVDWQPPVVTVEVVCGKGTYIRSLAYDLGQILGCGAHLKSLIRLQCGPFNLGNAISVPQLEDAFRHGYWQRYIYPVDYVLSHWAAVVVNGDIVQAIRNGRSIDFSERYEEDGLNYKDYCRAYASDGCFLGVLGFDYNSRLWHPEKVFQG
ncbi:tRNA pseudouridine(55) synthase TruB [Chloroflexota bacterium]